MVGPADGDKPTHTTKTIDELFGDTNDNDDPFNQLGNDEPAEAAEAGPVVLDEKAEEDDPFAGIGGEEAEAAPAPEIEPDVQEEEPVLEVDQAELDRQKYYDDLMAEFDGGAESPLGDADAPPVSEEYTLPPTAAAVMSDAPRQAVPPVQALFGEDDASFNDFLGSAPADDTPPGPSFGLGLDGGSSPSRQHTGDTSVQSLFSNTSDWMNDTTMDGSFISQGEDEALSPVESMLPPRPELAVASVDSEEEEVEVPEGWIDEYGNFQYYTAEDKAAVRESMLAERAAARANAPAISVPPPAPYHSENAARRTPQPDQVAQFASPPTHLPYAPPTFSRHSTGLPTPSFNTPQPISNPYTPGAAPVPRAQSSYFPPVPAQTAGYSAAPYDPYAPQSFATSSYASSPSQASPARSVPAATKPVPPKPQRVISNAYDPPLRTQKSFIRPVSAAPMASPFPAPSPSLATPPAPPVSLPPSGPPRRVPSVPPASSLGLSRLSKAIPESPSAYEPVQPSPYGMPDYSASAPSTAPTRRDGPPSRPSSQASQRPKAVPNAFDPPLRPPSVARSVSRPVFTPPPPAPPALLPPPPPSGPPQGPSRPSSRGGQKRATPSFEPPPPLPAKRAPPIQPQEDRYRQPVMPPMPPPRPITPEQEPALEGESGVPRDAGWPHLTSAAEDDEMDRLRDGEDEPMFERKLEEEEDPEGGGWREDEDAQEASRQIDVDEEGDSWVASRRPSSTAPPPAPPAQLAPRPPPLVDRQPSYDPYAPSTSTQSYTPSVPSQNGYAPAQAAASPPTPKQEARSFNMSSPAKTRPPIPTSFAPPAADPYAPSSSSYQPSRPVAQTSQSSYQPAQSPYEAAPISIPVQPPTPYLPSDPYAPNDASSNRYAANRSISPAHSAHPSLSSNNLYAPNRTASPANSSQYGASPQNNYFQSMHLSPTDTSYVPQQVLEQRPLSEDPLGRCTLSAKNAPLAVFGFGGMLVTAFPGAAEDVHALGHNRTPSYGYASGRGQLLIRPIGTVMEVASSSEGAAAYPGPLLLDPSNPKGSAGDKKKKEAVLAYLEARAEEIEKGLPYLKSSASGARREEEGKLLLVRLLSALLIGEGKFSGSPKVEEALKKALASPSESTTLITPGNLGSAAYGTSTSTSTTAAATPAQLSALSDMLVSGDKRDALEYASGHGLWSHALVIASSLGPELWKETLNRFIQAELAGEGVAGLRASYSLFAGADPSIAEDLFGAASITDDPSKDQWREVIASVVFNGRPGDASCLDDLAGRFMQRGLLNVAYACSLLSPLSPFIDPSPTAFDRPIAMMQDTRNEDAVIFAEIAEYARGMIAVPKGQEVPFPGLPALLPYKLQRAWQAAEQGEVDLAKKYCNAVEAATKLAKTGPSLLLPHHVSSLEDLLERLTGSPSIEPAKGLSARKAPTKPGFDKLGSWIGGRLTTFIAGEDDTSSSATSAPKTAPAAKGAAPAGAVGPFSHFSTISPAPSRNSSVPDFAANGGGYLGVTPMDGRRSGMPSPQSEMPPTTYGQGGGGYSAWGEQSEQAVDEDQEGESTPMPDDVGELLNPMAALTFGGPSAPASSSNSYAPKPTQPVEDDDEDDLGFGNAGLSRNRTPRPADSANGGDAKDKGPAAESEKTDPKADKGGKKDEASLGKDEAKPAGWFKGWFGKKEGDAAGPGPIRAKLGEENAMVFDKELRRWVVKGQKPEAAPAPPPPPPRSQTVSPGRAARPPASGPPGSSSPFATMPRSVSGAASSPSYPSDDSAPRRGPPQPRSGLAESVTADQAPPAAAALSAPKPSVPGNGMPSAPPGPPGMGKPPGGLPTLARPPGASSSIDDLLSRPPSKRPGSAASKKGARNRYVDVFQQPAEK